MGSLTIGKIWDWTMDFAKTQVAPWSGSGSTLENLLFNATPVGGYRALYGDPKNEADIIKEQQEQAAALAQQADIASKQAAADAIAKAAADKVAADKAKADQEAEAAATLLAKRRRASSAYSQGEQGILGAANVTRKTLLGG